MENYVYAYHHIVRGLDLHVDRVGDVHAVKWIDTEL